VDANARAGTAEGGFTPGRADPRQPRPDAARAEDGRAKQEWPRVRLTGRRPSLTRNVQRRGFDPAADDAGIDATFHDLRHYFGSRLASRGLTARQIADAMGHRRTSTTERYVSRFNGSQSDERVRAAMSS
jgi:integrase